MTLSKPTPGVRLYAVLGLSPNATPAEIRRAYLKLAKTTHPDAGGDAEDFNAIKFAYDVLSNPEARQHYDQTGEVKSTPSQENENANLYELIINAVDHLLAQIESKEMDPATVDMSDALMQWFDAKIRECEDRQDKMNLRRKSYVKIQKRFKHKKKKENIIEILLDGRIKNLIRHISNIGKETEKLKAAKELCNEYSFSFETIIKTGWSVVQFGTSSSTSTMP